MPVDGGKPPRIWASWIGKRLEPLDLNHIEARCDLAVAFDPLPRREKHGALR